MTSRPETTTDPLDTPLPCDVRCGPVKFSKGVALRTLVDAATRWHALAAKTFPTPAEEAVAEFQQAFRAFKDAVNHAPE